MSERGLGCVETFAEAGPGPVVLRNGTVIWAIPGFRLVTDPLTTRGRLERAVSEVISEQE